jgi:hypothetical protein
MARVAVPAEAPVMLTGLVAPKLNVGGFTLPVGLVVMAAVSATAPVKPPEGATVMVEMFPVLAPGATETAAPVIEKLGLATVTGAVPVAARYLASPE